MTRVYGRMLLAGLVAAYLAAIVAANLSVAYFGPRAAIYNAFLLIGLDLTVRDRLHDAWQGQLRARMAALVFAGSAVTYAAGLLLGEGNVGRVALASAIAFACAFTADAAVYHWLRRRRWEDRANGSNLAGSAVDSAVFLPLAFGGFPFAVMFAQFCAKVAGGYVWTLVLRRSPGDEWLQRNQALYGRAAP